jgi:hypothetical protein
VAFSSIEIDRVVGGKVEEHWFEIDLLGLMRQLGALGALRGSQLHLACGFSSNLVEE